MFGSKCSGKCLSARSLCPANLLELGDSQVARRLHGQRHFLMLPAATAAAKAVSEVASSSALLQQSSTTALAAEATELYVWVKYGLQIECDFSLEKAWQLSLTGIIHEGSLLSDAIAKLEVHKKPEDMWLLVECGQWQTHPHWQGPARALLQLLPMRDFTAYDVTLFELDLSGSPTGNTFDNGSALLRLTDRTVSSWILGVKVLFGLGKSASMRVFQKNVLRGAPLVGRRNLKHDHHGPHSSVAAAGSSSLTSAAASKLTLEAALQTAWGNWASKQPSSASPAAQAAAARGLPAALAVLQQHRRPDDMWATLVCGNWQRHPKGWQGPAQALMQLWWAEQPAQDGAAQLDFVLHELNPSAMPTGKVYTNGNQLMKLTDRATWKKFHEAGMLRWGVAEWERARVESYMKKVFPRSKLVDKRRRTLAAPPEDTVQQQGRHWRCRG